jgi:adenylate kinase
MRLILLGSPGSGKGTQAQLLSERLGLMHVGTGDILRDAVRTGTPAGKLAEPYVKQGMLVPDALVNELVNARFDGEDRPTKFVMDGYPRTLGQAESFDLVLHSHHLDVDAVVFLQIDDEEIVKRLTGRWSCPRCKATYHLVFRPPKKPGFCDRHPKNPTTLIQRVDDREETVRERLRLYHNNTVNLIPYYRAKGLLREVDGEGDVEKVYCRILQAVSDKTGSQYLTPGAE